MTDVLEYLRSFDWNETSIRWCLAWALALVATFVNLKKDVRGLRITIEDPEAEPSVRASAWWFARQNLVKFMACTFMVMAGANSVARGSGENTRNLLEIAAYVLCANQVWNIFDRWRVEHFLRRERRRSDEGMVSE